MGGRCAGGARRGGVAGGGGPWLAVARRRAPARETEADGNDDKVVGHGCIKPDTLDDESSSLVMLDRVWRMAKHGDVNGLLAKWPSSSPPTPPSPPSRTPGAAGALFTAAHSVLTAVPSAEGCRSLLRPRPLRPHRVPSACGCGPPLHRRPLRPPSSRAPPAVPNSAAPFVARALLVVVLKKYRVVSMS
uniref:Uncharacterized protein n=1 Tax=Oryza nivara TaxID=4536 RepID=A0A0E0FKX7_ORYNI